MVGEIKLSVVSRSLVRVPGSGKRNQGGSAPAVSCDLGRVSSFAASIPVNPNLPAIMTGSKWRPSQSHANSPPRNKLALNLLMSRISSSFITSARRPLNSDAESEAHREIKRPRLDVQTPPVSATSQGTQRDHVPSTQPVRTPSETQSSGGQETLHLRAIRRFVIARRRILRQVPQPNYSNNVNQNV